MLLFAIIVRLLSAVWACSLRGVRSWEGLQACLGRGIGSELEVTSHHAAFGVLAYGVNTFTF